MSNGRSKQRLYASLLMLGACILLFRITTMLLEGALGVLALWVGTLLIVEFSIDAACLLTSLRWFIQGSRAGDRIPLRLGAAAAFFHAFRVLIFVLGRIGPWIDFDVRPEQRALHPDRWSWGGVYFAAAMAVLGVISVIVIWRLRRHARKKSISTSPHFS